MIDPTMELYNREELLAATLVEFEMLYNTLMEQGFAPIQEEYYKYWLHKLDQNLSYKT